MAPTIIVTQWILLLAFLSAVMKPGMLIHGQPQVPCLFFFGDSRFDYGNYDKNNPLITSLRADYRPYGIDYFPVPTGRFTNGRNIPDFIASELGFVDPIKPFADTSDSDGVTAGVNYASGGAGILDETGILWGDRKTMNRQLVDHERTIGRIRVWLLDNGSKITTKDYLNKCLYVVNIGSSDYLDNYFLTLVSPTSLLFTPNTFAEILVHRFAQQLTTLYNSGARKVAVFGLDSLGCFPRELDLFRASISKSGCVDSINEAVELYNKRLRMLIEDFNTNSPGAQFIYINTTSISSTIPSFPGIKVVKAACCPVDSVTGLCRREETEICVNRNEYAFWDGFHRTDNINLLTVLRSYDARVPSDVYPVDIKTLVQQ